MSSSERVASVVGGQSSVRAAAAGRDRRRLLTTDYRRPTPQRRAALLAGLALGCMLAACNAPIHQYDLNDQALTCDEANRLSYRTLEAMRYKVSEFQPGSAGQEGVIRASRAEGQEGTKSVTVTVECTPAGANIDASEDGAFLNQLEFKRAFHHAFLNVVSMRAARDQLDQQIIAGTAPASQQRRDLKVVVEPVRGPAAKLDFAFDLAAAGILPVRVDITNLTPRTYSLDVSAIRLTRADRERVAALDPKEAAERISRARQGGSTQPLTTLSPDAIGDALAVRQLTASEIAPGAQRQGFLYFPLGDYDSARVVLTDKETGEDEGVRVEF